MLMLAASCGLCAQSRSGDRHRLGLKLGLVNSTITGGRVETGSKGAYTAGAWLELKLNKRWTGQFEIIFIEKGTGGINHKSPRIGEYWVGLYYFEFPVLFQYHLKKFMLEFGPGLGALTYGHEILHGAPSRDLADAYPFAAKELSFNVGAGYSIGKKWNVGLRFTHSLLPVRKQIPDIPAQVYNRVFTLSFGRHLNFRNPRKEAGDQN